MNLTRIDAEKRFWKFVDLDFETGCWNWTGSIRNSYSQFRLADQRQGSGHRFSYETFIGKIPEGYHIDHLCRNHICVNPKHLEAVTPKVNTWGGFGPCALNGVKTECKHGHKFTKENTYLNPDGTGRRCRQCRYDENVRKRNQRRNATY